MNRIHIALPQRMLFHTAMAVQIGDINYGHHLANDAVLRLCHEARLRWLQSLGFSEMDVAGAGLIMADAALQYQKQAFYADLLHIALGIGDVGRCGFALIYQLTREADQAAIARVQTGMVFFDYERGRMMNTPAAFLAAISTPEASEA